jgi:hypothetical protein
MRLGSINARALVDAKYSREGVKLGCPRLTALEYRLKPLYAMIQDGNHAHHTSAIQIEKSLNDRFTAEMENLLEQDAALTALINPDDPIQPDLNAQAVPMVLIAKYPLIISGLRLIKQYDKLILLIDFLYKTNQLGAQQPHLIARKMREKAGKPVRRFMTQVSKELAAAGLSN